LQQLRDNYRNGDRSQSQQIQQMENQVEEDREELKSLRNSIIELEK
jgi:hypothetical protein